MNRVILRNIPEPPSANRWWRMGRSGPKGQNHHMVLGAEARIYMINLRAAVQAITKRPDAVIKTGTVGIYVHWYRARKAGDLDKRLGVLLDALQGVVYENDGQVVAIDAHRYESQQDFGYVDLVVAARD